MYPSQKSTDSTAPAWGHIAAPSKHAEPIASVTTGPATAIRNSAPADGMSPAILATPPNSHNVMPSIRTPS